DRLAVVQVHTTTSQVGGERGDEVVDDGAIGNGDEEAPPDRVDRPIRSEQSAQFGFTPLQERFILPNKDRRRSNRSPGPSGSAGRTRCRPRAAGTSSLAYGPSAGRPPCWRRSTRRRHPSVAASTRSERPPCRG